MLGHSPSLYDLTRGKQVRAESGIQNYHCLKGVMIFTVQNQHKSKFCAYFGYILNLLDYHTLKGVINY